MTKKKKSSQAASPKGAIPAVFGSRGLGVETTGVPTDLEVLAKLEPPTGLNEFYKMQFNDPIIGGIMWHVESLFRRTKVYWDGKVPENVLGVLGNAFWGKILTELSSTLTYGFSVSEEIWQIIDGLPMLVDIEPRFQPTIDSFQGNYIQQSGPDSSAEIPASKVLHLTIGAQARSPYGTSFLRSVYKPYFMKTNIEASEANSLDRDLGGLPVMTAPEGFDFMRADSESATYDPSVANTLNWAINVVQNIRRDSQQGVVIPNGWELKLLRAEGDSKDPSDAIRRYNSSICVGLLQSFLAPIVDTHGRGSQTEIHLGILTSAINAIISSFVDEINAQTVTKLQRIYKFNGKLAHTPLTNYNLRDLASYIGRLIGQEAIQPNNKLEESILGVIDMPYVEQERVSKVQEKK